MKFFVKSALLLLALSFGVFAQDSLSEKSLFSALDSINKNVIGFAIDGKAKGGVSSSVMSSKALPNEESVSEYSAYTDFLLGFSVSPSNETRARFDLKFHKDWQSAYREGNNSPIIRWWSYDGEILNKKLKFNLGTMKLSYTPLTIYLPEPELIAEPEIFKDLKRDAMEERYLDGTNRRLLQGVNAEFNTSLGFFDNILLQGTVLRLRKNANTADRIFYDFDRSNDRYGAAARIGFEFYGVNFGVNDVYVFDRKSSAQKPDSLVYFEKNNVLSFELGADSKKWLNDSPFSFGVNAEYALSRWSLWEDYRIETTEMVMTIDGTGRPDNTQNLVPSNTGAGLTASGVQDTVNRYVTYTYKKTIDYKSKKLDGLYNKGALLAGAFAAFDKSPFEVKLSGNFVNVNKDFEAELAASPAYLPNLPILNSNADLSSSDVLSQFRTSSLENLYYSLYYTLPMNGATIISGLSATPDALLNSGTLSSNGYLYNNYKFSQYYRNAYTQQTFTKQERDSVSKRLDPSVNLALPYGYATPDRKGGDGELNFVFNKAVQLKGVFGKFSSETSDYTRLGGGFEVNVTRLAGIDRALTISGSFEQNKEENGLYNPKINRIMAGAKVGIWRGLSLLGGVQKLDKEFENAYLGIIDKTAEILALGGPQIKISERAFFNLQGGLLSNSITAQDGTKLDIDKYIASATVSVEF